MVLPGTREAASKERRDALPSRSLRFARTLRRALLAAIFLDLGMIAARVVSHRAVLDEPGGPGYAVEPVAILVLYAAGTVAVTAAADAESAIALRVGTAFGTLTGAMWILNVGVETFANLSGPCALLASAPLLLGGFALWGFAGALATRRARSLPPGVLAAVIAALVCVLITITFGLALAFTSLPRLAEIIALDPDYLRSHWTNTTAFAIANQFAAAASHLLFAPIVAVVVGGAGALLGRGSHRPPRDNSETATSSSPVRRRR